MRIRKYNLFIRYLSVLIFILLLTCFAIGKASWSMVNVLDVSNAPQIFTPTWIFEDIGFAKLSNVRSVTNLVASQEQSLTINSTEALRLTSTTGTQTKDHTVHINFDRDYVLSEIQFFKFEFDYYHRYKREQYNKGFPTVQFMINNSTLGTSQGGTDTCTETSAFVATPINEDWWHLEYFVFAHMPTIVSHNDTPIGLNKKVNGVRITDRTMYDYADTTAFVVIDNMQFSSETTSRLGIFNRWTTDSAGKFFWLKVAFSGELHSCVLTSSDTEIAVPEFSADDVESTTSPFPNGSPFYFQLLKAGTVTLTATLEIDDNHEIHTISYTITVT